MSHMDKKILDLLILVLSVFLLSYGYNHYGKNSDVDFKNIIDTVVNQNNKPASYYISLAKEAYFSGDYQKAIDLWNQSLDAKPFHPDLIYHDLGLCYIQLKNYDKALESYNKAIEINPNDLAFYYMRAIVYYYINNTKEYIANLEKAISLRDKPSVNQNNVVYSYKRLAKFEKNSGNDKKANEYNALADEYSAKLNKSKY